MLPHGEVKYWTHLSTNLPDEPEEDQRWSLWSLSPSCWCKSGLTSLLVVADTALRTRQLDKQSRAYSISYLVRRLCPINLAGLHIDHRLVALVSVKLHLTPSHREHHTVLSHLLIPKVESTRVFCLCVRPRRQAQVRQLCLLLLSNRDSVNRHLLWNVLEGFMEESQKGGFQYKLSRESGTRGFSRNQLLMEQKHQSPWFLCESPGHS